MSKMDQLRAMRERTWAKASPKEKKRRALEAMAKPGVAGVNLMISEMEREGRRRSGGRPKGPVTVPLPVRIPPTLLAKLDAMAAARSTTRNGLVISILAEAMAK